MEEQRKRTKCLSEEFAETVISDAERFVVRMERYLREVGAISKET
jgi:hypothetical protein